MTHTSFDDSPEKQPVRDLDQRLTDYYGPPRNEQRLPSGSWLAVQEQLTRRRGLGLRAPRWLSRARRARSMPPFYLHEALDGVFREISRQDTFLAPRLRYHLRRRRLLPTIKVSLWCPSTLHLACGRAFERVLEQEELDVLLACGLARSHCYRRPGRLIISWLLGLLILMSGLASSWLIWMQGFTGMWWLSLAVLVGALLLLRWHRYRLAFLADARVVSWLGRERTCLGLRGLLARSAHPRRPGWSEPSLAVRVHRVCVQPAATSSERLTPVP